MALDFIHANAGPLMGKAGKSKEFLRDLMKKTIVYSKDKTTGEVRPYPPKIYMKVYDDVVMKNPDKSVISDSVNNILRTGTVMTAIIQPTGISFQKGTISVQYKLAAAQIIEHAKSSVSADFDVIDDDAPTAAAPVAAAVGGAGGAVAGGAAAGGGVAGGAAAGGSAAEVEEDEEEDIITPAPVAAPAEEESEEEEILPPQPTPPAKKKVVATKKAAAK
jgi:hypothetical protein